MMKKSIFLLLWVVLLTVCFSNALRAQSANDGQILVEGDFTTPAGQARYCLDRLSMDSAAIQDLRATTNLVVWESSGVGFGTLTNGANPTFTGTGSAVVASQAGNANWNPTPNVTNTFAMTASMVTSTCILDHNTRPTNWNYSQVGGTRGPLGSWSDFTRADETTYRYVVNSAGELLGMWYSIGNSLATMIAYDPEAMFHPMIKTNYQARLLGVDMVVTKFVSAGTSNLTLKIEIKGFVNETNQMTFQAREWGRGDLTNGSFPKTFPINVDTAMVSNVAVIAWVLDHGTYLDAIDVDSVGLRIEMPLLTNTAERAFLISLAMLLDNFDETTGMVQDNSYDKRGSYENTTATAKLAKLLAMAMKLDMVDTNAARSAIIKIANVFTNMPRGPTNRIAGTNQLLPHFTMNGGTAPHPDSEWASGDTAFALEDLAVALQMIGDPHGQLPGVTNMFGQIDWRALLSTNGYFSHGYDKQGTLFTYCWDGFGVETFGVSLAALAGDGILTTNSLSYDPERSGSGFLYHASYPVVPQGTDRRGFVWNDIRQSECNTQIMWYATRNTNLYNLGLFGLSAAEIPVGTDYKAYGIGTDDGDHQIVTPHYSGLIAPLRLTDSTRMWESLESLGWLSPLDNVESLAMNPTNRKDVTVNFLRGSWNLALQAEGWALTHTQVYASVWSAFRAIPSLYDAYQTLMAPPQIAVTPSSQNFGSIPVGTTADRAFSVQNAAGGTLSGSASVPAPYSIVSGGSYSLGSGASQTVIVRYSPTSAGTHNQTVTFTGGGGTIASVTGLATDSPSGTVQFKSSTYSVSETGGSVRIYISRTGGSYGAASVNYATSNGTAMAGSDFTARSGSLNWTSGDAADKSFDVPIVNDSVYEGDEQFKASLSGVSGAGMGSPSSTTVTIKDDEIVPAVVTIWSSTTAPTLVDGGPDSAVELGVKFKSDVAGMIAGIRFYKAGANTGAHIGNLWTSNGTQLATVTFTGETASGWQQALFATPVAIASNTVYVASYHADNGHYSADLNYFQGKGMDSPPLHALTNSAATPNGVYAYGSGSVFPNQTWNAANYWVDVVFQAGLITLTSIAVTPTNSSILTGASRQFTATGTYSDGSTQNLSNQVTWASSNTRVATINTSGLATGISTGTTTISAALGGVSNNTTLTVRAPATLTSIAVTPTNSSILTGASRQFTATGTYSDGSTQNLSNQVTWASSNTAVATINTSGLATGVSTGTTTISATLAGVSGNSLLTVQRIPLSITTIFLPTGVVNMAYTGTLAATGGTLPYTWSLAGGSLAPGLTLTGSGVITGKPTASGIFGFTVQVRDTGSPVQTTNKALSITIAAVSVVSIWPTSAAPGVVDGGPDSAVELGVKFKSDVAGMIAGIRFYKAGANTGAHIGNLWTSNGTQLATVTFTGETASGWQQALFATPVAIASNTVYVASYHADNGHYSADLNYFQGKGMDSPPLHALTNSAATPNGVYAYGSGSVFPNQTWNAANYWVDVVFQAGLITLTSIAVTPTNSSILTGVSRQFTATGTYSDGSTQNLSNQVTWASSNTRVATINTSGLATGISTGTTTISAALGGVSNNTTLTVRAPATLTSIAVTPTNSSILTGASRQFTATGTYSDGSTQNLSNQVTWASSNTRVATINTSGLATGISTGTTTISAALGGVSNNTTLTVRAPATLTSIAVTPTNSSILTGASRQFTATGTYSDGSTQNLSNQVTWASSNTAVATINTSGLATGVSTGTTTISATLAGVSGNSLLTVQRIPLSITTIFMPTGVVNMAYTGTLAATGGTLPYTWSLAGGSLAPGLTLTGSGVITGKPTASGIFGFTAQVRDTGSPVQTTNKALSITIAAVSVVSIWPTSAAPGVVDGGPDSAVELGVKFRSDVAGFITGIRFYKAGANTGSHTGNLWTSTGTLLAKVTFTNETISGWQQALFATPVAIASNTVYVASYHADNGHYSADLNYFQGKGMDSPPLHALTNSAATPNGVYAYGSSSVFPNQTWNAANYWVDVVFQAGPITLTSIAVTPTNSSILTGVSRQFTATGTYSDGSTQNLSNQVTWASSNTRVATINTSGLATGISTGTTTISAALGGVSNNTTLTVRAPATLTSIAVTPTNSSILTGASRQFTATGTYSDGSTQNLSNQVTWASSNTRVATINTSGLATGISTGTTTISAALGGVSNNTTLTVRAPATLTSIAVTPTNSSILTGASRQFTATGTYSDGSTQNLSNQVTWASSNTAVATINTSGLATGVSTGTTTISATLAGVSGNSLLTVQRIPLSITTIFLPTGVVNMAYTGTLAATGGTLPYTWSLAGGSLAPGLTLTGSGVITGKPTASGIFGFTAQVRDTGSPVQTTNKALSITIAAVSVVSIWPTSAAPGVVDGGPDSAVELGVKFRSDVAGFITGIRFYKAGANTGSHTGNLWTSTGTLLAKVTFTNETISGWQQALFATPVAIASNTVYVASYHSNNGHYSEDLNYFQGKGMDSPPLHALTNSAATPNGVYAYGANSVFPNQTWNAANYWVDVVFQAGSPPLPPTQISNALMAAGASSREAVASAADENVERWPWVWTSGDLSREWGASNLIDGNTNTMWIGNDGGEPWQVILDLGVVTDVTGVQVMFQDTAWTNMGIIGSRDSEIWFDYMMATNTWVALRYLYVNFWGDEHGAKPPTIREIIWWDR